MLVILFTFSVYAEKSKISILYVGWNPGHKVQTMKRKFETKEAFAERKFRWADFEQFLNNHFFKVKMVHHLDYVANMSDQYDVTIFDAMPKLIKPMVTEIDSKGRHIKHQPQYIPEDFSAAAITISTNSEKVRWSLKNKLDWC